MTQLISDSKAVEDLFEQVAPDIDLLFRHPATGFPIELPANTSSLVVSASLLNIYLYDPEVVIVWNNQFQPHQLAVCAPYIKASRHRIALVARSIKDEARIRDALPLTPLWILEQQIFAYQQLPIAPSLKIFLYPDNDRMNEHTVHNYPCHMHVHIGHGDSEKAASANRFSAVYDYIFLADKSAIDRFRRAGVEISDNKFLPIGAPTFPGLKLCDINSNHKKVLYAPTWEGTSPTKNFSSLGLIHETIAAFGRKAPENLQIRLHPSLGSRDVQFRKYAQTMKPWSELNRNKVEQFNDCDLLLCDISGILSEFLFTGRPIAIPVASDNHWLLSHIGTSQLCQYVYLWHFDQVDLGEFLNSISDDPLQDARMKRRSQLYASATNFNDAVSLFDRAIESVILEHYWRSRRTGHDHKKGISNSLPISGVYSDLAKKIQKGTLTLNA